MRSRETRVRRLRCRESMSHTTAALRKIYNDNGSSLEATISQNPAQTKIFKKELLKRNSSPSHPATGAPGLSRSEG
jgi:hypothetical protein